jgi:hypothetical protein
MTEFCENPDVNEDHIEDIKIVLLGLFCIIGLPTIMALFFVGIDKFSNYMNDDLRIYPLCIVISCTVIISLYFRKKIKNID